jgi:hypothetical protein
LIFRNLLEVLQQSESVKVVFAGGICLSGQHKAIFLMLQHEEGGGDFLCSQVVLMKTDIDVSPAH